MTTQAMPNAVRLPLIRIGSVDVLGCVLIAVVGGILSQQRGGQMVDGLWTLLATIPGVLIVMGILRLIPPRPSSEWGIPVLAGTLIRAMGTLTIGIAIYIMMGPTRIPFFFTLLGALMATLVIDVSSVLSLINKHTIDDSAIAGAEGAS